MKDCPVKLSENGFDKGRRDFGKIALAGALGRNVLPSITAAENTDTNKGNTNWPIESGIKPAVILHSMPTDEELTFVKQLGVKYVEAWMPAGNDSYEDMLKLRSKVEDSGLKLFSTDILDAFNSLEILRGLPGRDRKIKQFQDFIRNLGRADLHTTTYAWITCEGIAGSTGTNFTRGCRTRQFEMKEAEKVPVKRAYTIEDLWDNYAYFLERILPVAEDSGVRLALHQTDPPTSTPDDPQIFCSNDDFQRGLEMANHSEYWGICFCVGTHGEMAGPDGRGEDVIGAIRHFGGSGHIFNVHFRNVSAPLPNFIETFVDNGYLNMYEVMKAFWEAGFDGTMVPDHIPRFTNEKTMRHLRVSGTPYVIGYIRGLLQALEYESARK